MLSVVLVCGYSRHFNQQMADHVVAEDYSVRNVRSYVSPRTGASRFSGTKQYDCCQNCFFDASFEK